MRTTLSRMFHLCSKMVTPSTMTPGASELLAPARLCSSSTQFLRLQRPPFSVRGGGGHGGRAGRHLDHRLCHCRSHEVTAAARHHQAGQRGPKLALVVVLRLGQHGRPGRAHLMLEGGIYVYYEACRPRAAGPNRCQGTSIKVRVSAFIKSGRCNQKGTSFDGPQVNRGPPFSWEQKQFIT